MPVLVKNCSQPLDHVYDADCKTQTFDLAGICTCWLSGEVAQGGGEAGGASGFLEKFL